MSSDQLIYHGVEITLNLEARGWTAQIPRFGRTMYFPTAEDAISEAVRLVNAFLLPRMLRSDKAA